MAQIVELKQNRNFIEPSFPGYKLSLQEIPTFSLNLGSKVHRVFPTNDQYTYKHAKLFTLQNHILASETNNLEGTEIIYYIGVDRQLYRIKLDILGLEETCLNWKVPHVNPKQDYNFTMMLANQELAIVSDGSGSLYFIDRVNEWKCIFNDTLHFSFLIIDCKMKNDNIHLLLFNIVSSEDEDKEIKHKSVLHWVQYKCNDMNWNVESIHQLPSESELHYAFISPDTSSLYIFSCEGGFVKEEENKQTNRTFTWCQTNDSITIYIMGTRVLTNCKHLTVYNHDEIVVDGELDGSIDSSLTTWTRVKSELKHEILEIILCKDNECLWSNLIKDKPLLGEYLLNEQNAKAVHAKLSHLCSDFQAEEIPTKTSMLTDQVEECDFVSSKGALLERITADLKVSHRVMLTQEIIFIDAEQSSFAVQQNEDVCPYRPREEDDTWTLEHFGSLYALGYIRASKQRRKFTTSAPDTSYAIVAESSQHIFVYRQDVDVISGELRNRTTGRHVRQLAQQQVVELPKDYDILGVKAYNDTLFVLCENVVYAFKMR